MRILVDGRPHAPGEPALPADHPGLLEGAGVFTTLRLVGGRPLFWPDHVARLADGCRALGATAPGADELREEAGRAGAGMDDARVRITLVENGRGAVLRVVAARPYAPPREPWTLARIAAPGWTGDGKTTSRVAHVRARRAAPEADETLVTDGGGRYLEGSRTNVFLLRGNGLLTPPADGRIVDGIARRRLLALAPRLGLSAEEAELGDDEACAADACLVTNALLFVHPVAEIRSVARFPPHPAADRLRDALLRSGSEFV